MSKHTPEPWWDEAGVAHAKGPDWTEDNHSCVHPITGGYGTDDDVPRAIACVNACAGFADPAELRTQRDDLLAVARRARATCVCTSTMRHDIPCLSCMARLAVAEAEGTA